MEFEQNITPKTDTAEKKLVAMQTQIKLDLLSPITLPTPILEDVSPSFRIRNRQIQREARRFIRQRRPYFG